jgi:hypothetical protein
MLQLWFQVKKQNGHFVLRSTCLTNPHASMRALEFNLLNISGSGNILKKSFIE